MPPTLIRSLRLSALALLVLVSPACGQRPRAAEQTSASGALSPDSTAARADRSRHKGSAAAPITIYEFSDYQCPFCREFELSTFAALDSAFVQTGQVQLKFFNLPLPNHPNAWGAAEAALCAGAQGKYWPMHDRLFADQRAWAEAARPGELYERYARELGLDAQAFRTCTLEDQVARVLVEDLTFGASRGVNGTPTFVVLRQPAAGENPQDALRVLSGAQPIEAFRLAIEELRAKK